MRKSLIPAFALVVAFGEAAIRQGPRLSVLPAKPLPGAIVRLTLTASVNDSIVSVSAVLEGEPIHFISAGPGTWHGIGGIPTTAPEKIAARAILVHASGKRDTVRASMTLPPKPVVKSEPLKVDTTFTSQTLDTARIARENRRAQEIGRRAHDSPARWTGSFLAPRASRVTSTFGSGRVFNNSSANTSTHGGMDFAGAVGDSIHAANRGVVVLVDSFLLAGNVVYIDHGAGVVTGYFHMSKQLVAVGDTVARGQVIGLVGQTGRVTGPHLHWSARYGATTVNPGDLLTLDPAWYSAKPKRPKA